MKRALLFLLLSITLSAWTQSFDFRPLDPVAAGEARPKPPPAPSAASAQASTPRKSAQDMPRAFDRARWQADYHFLKTALEQSYSHLAWFGSPESGVNLPALDRRTRAALDRAQDDAQAQLAIRNFVTSLHDGHLSELPALEPAAHIAQPEPARHDLTLDDAVAGCAALGFGDRSQVFFSLPFESLAGFTLEADGVSSAFRSGVIVWNGERIGIVRIKNFSARQYATECVRTWAANPKLDKLDPRFQDLVTDAWFESLARELTRFRERGLRIVIVDIGGNSGGNDSGDWAARLFTTKPVRSAPLLMSAAPIGEAYLSEQIEEVEKARMSDPGPGMQSKVRQALTFLEAQKADLKSRHCDMSWVWDEQRPFAPMGCSRLIDVGFASGPLVEFAPESYGDRRAAARLYWPATVDPWRGAWTGLVYVLTNSTTYSSAEMFAAVMKDNGIARIIGTRTGGDGCGFMREAQPLVLPHSHLRFRVPDCVRLRADGSDEVAGVSPDLPVLPTDGESPRARGARVLNAVLKDANESATMKEATREPHAGL